VLDKPMMDGLVHALLDDEQRAQLERDETSTSRSRTTPPAFAATRSTNGPPGRGAASDAQHHPELRRDRAAVGRAQRGAGAPRPGSVHRPDRSGKSTSLATLVDAVNAQRPCHILTIEDPIEYLHPNKMAAVNQREIGIDAQSFERALRSALREDPDVVLVARCAIPRASRSRSHSPRPATSCCPHCTPTTPRRRSTASSTSSRPTGKVRSDCSWRAC